MLPGESRDDSPYFDISSPAFRRAVEACHVTLVQFVAGQVDDRSLKRAIRGVARVARCEQLLPERMIVTLKHAFKRDLPPSESASNHPDERGAQLITVAIKAYFALQADAGPHEGDSECDE